LLTHPLYGWAALKIDNYSPIHRVIRLPLHGVSREPTQAGSSPRLLLARQNRVIDLGRAVMLIQLLSTARATAERIPAKPNVRGRDPERDERPAAGRP